MLKYLLAFLYVASHCVALEHSPYILAGKSVCEDENMSKTQQFLCMYGQNLNSASQAIYITGTLQSKIQTLANLLDKEGTNYLLTPGMGAHKFHTRKLPWSKAHRICYREGGHLAVINSNSEEKLLLRMLDENKIDKAWIGVHDLFEEGDWITVLNEPMESAGYSKWTTKFANLPDNVGGKQHCGQLLKEGGIDDTDCSVAQPFFCEISL